MVIVIREGALASWLCGLVNARFVFYLLMFLMFFLQFSLLISHLIWMLLYVNLVMQLGVDCIYYSLCRMSTVALQVLCVRINSLGDGQEMYALVNVLLLTSKGLPVLRFMMQRVASGATLDGNGGAYFALYNVKTYSTVRKLFLCFLYLSSCMVRCGSGMTIVLYPFDTVRCGSASLERLSFISTARRPSLQHVDNLSYGSNGLIGSFWLWVWWFNHRLYHVSLVWFVVSMYEQTPGISGFVFAFGF